MMPEKDKIITIKAFSESKFKEKGSRFIGQAYPIERIENFNETLSRVKKQFFDASHHCYAYRLVNGEFKYSDAGEPTGTAGIRILNAIDHFRITNVLVVVIRYYGGTNLGVGPLGKAYYNSAKTAINSVEKIKKIAFQIVSIECDFAFTGTIHKTISDFGMKLLNTVYKENIKFTCLIKPNLLGNFKNYLIEKTGSSIKIYAEDEISYL